MAATTHSGSRRVDPCILINESGTVSSPYAPPSTPDPAMMMPCPSCGAAMTSGDVVSSSKISWRPDGLSALVRFIYQGRPIGKTKFGLGYRIPAYRCEPCRLYMIR